MVPPNTFINFCVVDTLLAAVDKLTSVESFTVPDVTMTTTGDLKALMGNDDLISAFFLFQEVAFNQDFHLAYTQTDLLEVKKTDVDCLCFVI